MEALLAGRRRGRARPGRGGGLGGAGARRASRSCSAAGAGLDERALLIGQADGAAVAIGAPAALRAAGVALAAGPAVPLRARRRCRSPAPGAWPRWCSPACWPATARCFWEDHLPDLVVHSDDAAADALAARVLAPLDGLPPARARLLRETLAAWLDHPGRPREIARVLHLHHQTVRYRLTRLRERFGDDALDDPDARFALALALRRAAG